MDPEFAEILKNTYTISQFNHRLRVLKFYLTQKLFSGEHTTDTLPEDLNWINTLSKDFLNDFTADNLTIRLMSLEEKINQSPILTLNLSFTPDEVSIAQIGEFVRAKFTTFTLLDIKYNPALIAGAALVWNGIYKDYSLKASIDSKKQEVLEEFKKVFR